VSHAKAQRRKGAKAQRRANGKGNIYALRAESPGDIYCVL
jgi:hypothetical protein